MTDLQKQLQSTLSGSYTLERELGGGGMSRVFLADEVKLARKVVVKVLSPELAAGISAERFEREILLAASLQQANIVPVLSTGETNGLPYYTMPFVEGESLRHRLAQEPALTISDTLRILGDVGRALQYAHDRGIVHRDIKPDNVLLSGGTAVVTDFGIAKALSASRTDRSSGATLTQLGTSIGTPAYMAPEQAAGDPNIDHRADIYAFGCMAYELLANHPPFHGRTPQRVLAAHMGEQPKPVAELRPDAPSGLAALVMRCLAKDAGERPQSAAEIILALNAVTSGSGMTAVPSVLMHGPAAFRRALLAYATSVVAVAAVAKAATVTIGLPSWVFPGALVVMALGLPVILFTGYVQSVARRALSATPGGRNQAHGTFATIALKASPHVSWKRTTRGGIYALGGFVALIIGFMVMRAFGIGPAGSLFGAGKLKQRDVVLVADFDLKNGADSGVAGVVAEGVRANLAQSASVTLFSPTNIAGALRRMQEPVTSRVDLPLAQRIAQREGVKAIVTGDITPIGNGFVIALRLVTADSGAVLAAFQETVDGPTKLVAGVDEVTRRLREKMGESLKDVQATPPLEQVTTASYEALRAYTEGTRIFDVERDFARAIPHLRRAVTLDTGFATAWRKLGTAYANLQMPASEVNAAVTKAFQLRSRMSENERYLTEGYYYMRGPGRDRQRAIAAYQALVDRGDSTSAANNLAVAYGSMRDFATAESLYRMAIRKGPENAIPVPNLALVLIAQNKRAAVDSLVAEGLKRNPNMTALLEVKALAPVVDLNYDRSEQLLDSMKRATTLPSVRSMTLENIEMLHQTRGRLVAAERGHRETAAAWAAEGAPGPALNDSVRFALFDAWFRNQPARTVARLDAALRSYPLASLPEADRPYGDIAVAYARAGDVSKARAIVAQIEQTKDTAFLRTMRPWVRDIQGEIAIAEKRPADAIVDFRKADTTYDGRPTRANSTNALFNIGRAFDLANQPDSAIVMWERYLTTFTAGRLVDDAFALAGIRKRLGELYEAKGNRAKAIEHFTQFVDLWKNADPELQPSVAEARRRLARLTAGESR
jgi:tetratricopeptide (TPR) repeat protein/tRNA A-37 threonylcarbamoyl transferase component Bud32